MIICIYDCICIEKTFLKCFKILAPGLSVSQAGFTTTYHSLGVDSDISNFHLDMIIGHKVDDM